MKRTLFRVLRRAGGLRAVASSGWRRDRLLIVCYHGLAFTDEHEWDPSLYVTPAHLRARLELLRDEGYRVLPLDEALTRLYDGTLPPRSVALTFDDGTTDFARLAVPLLAEFDAPATVYLTTYYAERRLPVFDVAMRYVLWKGRNGGADLAPLLGGAGALPLATEGQRAAAAAALVADTRERGADASAKQALLVTVADAVGVSLEELARSGAFHIMAPDVVAALPRGLVDVQLHTHRHRTPRDRDLFLRELDDNAASIRAMRGRATRLEHFCYPSGEYFGEFLRWLPERDVRFATTCVPALASRDAHPLLLPRFVDGTLQSDETFAAWASGVADRLPRRAAHRLDPARLQPPRDGGAHAHATRVDADA